MKSSELQSRAGTLVEDTLRSIPVVQDIRFEEPKNGTAADLRLEVDVRSAEGGTDQYVLVAEVNSNGQPRWARAAADALDTHVRERGRSDTMYGVFIAPYISETGAELLRERGYGYLDLAGNGRLAFDGVYLERTGNPNRFSARSELKTLFSPKASRVLRMLLMHPHEPWRMAALAEESDVSLGLVAKVKPLLLDREWAADTADGLVLTDPGTALDAWAAHFRRRRTDSHDFYGFGSVREIEDRIAAAAEATGAQYALAEFSGAERVAPHVRYSRAAAYVEAEALHDVAERAELRPVETGSNVRLFEPYDAGVFFGSEQVGGEEGGWFTAHPLQLYLDLRKAKGRGDEAADFLRRHMLVPMWETSRSGNPNTTSDEAA